ncbi:hypothetical protein AeNC1_010464 [Aphanomyces euteiches]|nr:hypothetical protein AeNC1_010464 [Aphanomyces euteiches]
MVNSTEADDDKLHRTTSQLASDVVKEHPDWRSSMTRRFYFDYSRWLALVNMESNRRGCRLKMSYRHYYLDILYLDTDESDGQDAARRGDLRRVRSLLASGANADYQNKLGKTPLIEAAWKGNFDVVKDLLAHGAAVDQADWNGYTPLHWASSNGNLDVVNELLAHGATVDPINKNDETPLHQAASKGEVDIVERLLDGDANRLLENKDGKTPRDLGNDDVKALFDTYQPKTKLYSIHEATDVIRQAIADIHATSDTLAIGSAILNLSLKAQVLRQRVLATALLVEAVMRQNMRQEAVDPSPALSSVLQDIQLCFETKLVTTQSWKVTFSVQMDDELRGKMDNLDARLAKAAKINVCYQVYGTIDDLRHAPGKMMDKMDGIEHPNDMETALGRGGFATVFKGSYYGQDVAVKRFDQIVQTDSVALEKMIAKEIDGWKDISHEPYILTLVGVCTKSPVLLLVSELCETNVRRHIRHWPSALFDLKGDNVLVTFHHTVAIADFGLSRSVKSLENTNTNVKRAGTLNWMSPEQYFMPRSVTSKSDVWSFGMTLWEILCDDTPLRICSEDEFRNEIYQREDDRPEKPQHLKPALEPLWTLITKCWRLKPEARPSAEEIVEYLKQKFGSQLAAL